MLGEMLRTATTFHELVTRLDPSKSLGPDQHVLGPDGRYHHPLQRTVLAIGAGAGAGAAIGGMTLLARMACSSAPLSGAPAA